jgi:glutamate/aspartate transport system substrate-binding protein
MVARNSPIVQPRDLAGKTVVVTAGTTNEQVLHALDAKLKLGLKILTAADHAASFQMLADGKVDSFATDDVLLYGLLARFKARDKFQVVGDFLSYEPYGIMFRKNEPQLRAVVDRTFRDLATNHDLVPLYNKWFNARLPTGERLDIAISPQLEDSFKALDESEGAAN